MERLTVHVGNEIWVECGDKIDITEKGIIELLKTKLAAYEDAEEQGRLIVLPCKVERVAEVALINVLLEYFDVGNSYTYELMRSKMAFSAGTMSMDDFQEWGDDDVFKLANYIVGHFCEEAEKAEKALEGMG